MMRPLGQTSRAVVLLVAQCAIVMAVAGKYLYERETLPRVWVRASVVDPDDALRGRYLALLPAIDACALPHTAEYLVRGRTGGYGAPQRPQEPTWGWTVQLTAAGGRLVPRLLGSQPGDGLRERDSVDLFLSQSASEPCAAVSVPERLAMYVPGGWQSSPAWNDARQPDKGLWVEVSVPPRGDLRPIRLAAGSGADRRVLNTD